MKSVNYTKKHHMYLMNHVNGDVIEVKMDHKDKSFKKLRLYRQDGLGNYYLDPHAQLEDQNGLATKENIVNAGKKVSQHIADTKNWHHKVHPIFNADHKIIDFEPRIALKHYTHIQNAKRYLRHLNNHHADFLFRRNNKGRLLAPWNYVKDVIYEDRNKEMVLAHKVHKLSK
ncbi:hypothetical protein [Lactobacillus sp. N54.MGS-719]|uniref:hypothetical protein n=1 Tax=Lactobacillus sp. N54.MGS-719 TaxID=1637512 RepID=UPI000623B8A4|nr:hypothetical protein [Lactobacillus sp. N54.MGS-719]